MIRCIDAVAADVSYLVILFRCYSDPILAKSGLQFDLTPPHGKMIASVMAALSEFERDLIRDRIKSGIAAAKARGKQLGRRVGQRPSDRKAAKVIRLSEGGLSYRLIGRQVGLSKNTVGDIVKRNRARKA